MERMPYSGATEERIIIAEQALGVRFPDTLRSMWLTYNRVELPRGHWRVFPVFDPVNARKTSNDIVYENTKGQELVPGDVLSIAESMSGSGNRLVLRRLGEATDSLVLLFARRTGKLTKWKGTLDDFLVEAIRCAQLIRRLASKYRNEA